MANRYLCGVPKEHCEGAHFNTNKSVQSSLGAGALAHSSPVQAFNCYKHYLLKQGYTQIGTREFSPPGDNGPVLVLTKQSHFGGKLRPGKSGEQSKSGVGNRFVPTRQGKKSCRAGLVFVV